MYAYKDGVYTNDDCNIHKTVRFKPDDIQNHRRKSGKEFHGQVTENR